MRNRNKSVCYPADFQKKTIANRESEMRSLEELIRVGLFILLIYMRRSVWILQKINAIFTFFAHPVKLTDK